MVLLHRRELLILSHWKWLAGPLLVAALACGDADEAAPEDEGAIVAEEAPVAERVVPDGDPMPSADVSGVPPYPGAIVWRLSPRRASEFDFVEAFTADSVEAVVEFYDERMGPPWRREEFEDAITWTLDPDMGAIFISKWDGSELPADAPEPLRQSRTGIGVSWRRPGSVAADSAAAQGT